jgi:hypothetical protein
MLSRNSTMRQPTLTQMEFVKPAGRKFPPLPEGWQRNTSVATGDTFYVNVASGRIVWKYGDMEKSPVLPAITPSRAKSERAYTDATPDNAVSGAISVYVTPRRPFKFGSSTKPIQLEIDGEIDGEIDDEVSVSSEAFSDMTNSQLVVMRPRKRLKLPRRSRFTQEADETQNAVVLAESGFGSADDHHDSDSSQSNSPPASYSQNYHRDEDEE